MPTTNTYTSLTDEAGCDAYLASHIDPEGDYLYRLYRATNIHTIHGRMASGHLQGRLLKMLVQMIRPKNILEVGTFSGYSAICMAEGLEEGGKLYTFEINDEMEISPVLGLKDRLLPTRLTFVSVTLQKRLPNWGFYLIWLSSMVTSAIIQKYMRSCCPSSSLVAISSLTTHCGLAPSLTLPTTTTNKRLVFAVQ